MFACVYAVIVSLPPSILPRPAGRQMLDHNCRPLRLGTQEVPPKSGARAIHCFRVMKILGQRQRDGESALNLETIMGLVSRLLFWVVCV